MKYLKWLIWILCASNDPTESAIYSAEMARQMREEA